MKVNLPKDYKLWFTISDLENAKEVIKCMKEDESSAKDYGKYAVEHVLMDSVECMVRVIEADAEVRPNKRIYGHYGESGRMDVWLNITARTNKGYLEVGAYLTDIWSIGSDTDLREHMWMQSYRKQD